MKKIELICLRNGMLFGNFISNVIGVQVVDVISQRSVSPSAEQMVALAARVDVFFIPLSFGLVASLILFYERPIRRYLNDRALQKDLSLERTLRAKQRLLNEPFFLIALNMGIWLVAAAIYGVIFHRFQCDGPDIRRMVFQTLLVGLVTSIIAFFVSERFMQKKMAPHLFPEGGLYMTPGTLRIRIRVRLAALIIACNIVPCVAFLGIVHGVYSVSAAPEKILAMLQRSIVTNCLIFIGVGLFLTFLVTGNLVHPLGQIIQVLKGIKRGRLDKKVPVTSNDEIGYTGDVINEMTEGLRERETMRQSLTLAREVQQNLLPKFPPVSADLDIAGHSIYCDQTGGDYFDFLDLEKTPGTRIGLVVGDVSGHGIPSALLMATTRAFLRLRSVMPGTIGQVVTDVNRQLARDVEDSGQFMTLFYLAFHAENRSLSWVRAGHDPGIFYDPATDVFTALTGPGIALGVDADHQFEMSEMAGLSRGQIIVLCTDGIWEARSASGEMFGKQRLQDLIRRHCSHSAAAIVSAIVDSLADFQNGVTASDDVTLVVAKVIR